LKNYFYKKGIQIEVVDSRNAASTFNILVKEGRRVAAAILPPIPTSAKTGKVLVKLSSTPL
jgi:NADH dehydrogenase [ubiquinone] 1 alpha subcomplex assembly factor 3